MQQNIPAITVNRYGDSSVLEYSTVPLSAPAGNEIQVRIFYSGVNYADIYFRKGLYKLPNMSDNKNYKTGAQSVLNKLTQNLKVKIDTILPLANAKTAHEYLEAGKSTGSILLNMATP